jgi:hypothetical protein
MRLKAAFSVVPMPSLWSARSFMMCATGSEETQASGDTKPEEDPAPGKEPVFGKHLIGGGDLSGHVLGWDR